MNFLKRSSKSSERSWPALRSPRSARVLPHVAEAKRNAQLETLVPNVIPIVDALRVRHRHQDPPHHDGDINRLGAEVKILDRHMSEYDRREHLHRLLTERPPRRPSSAWSRPPNDLDPRADIIERLLLRLDGLSLALLVLDIAQLLDVDRERGAVGLVVAADDLNDLASGDDAECAEDDGDGDVLVDRVVLEVDLVVLGKDVRLGFAFVGRPACERVSEGRDEEGWERTR